MVNNSNIKANASLIGRELNWFETVLKTRLTLHFGQECDYKSIWEITPPSYAAEDGYYAGFINHYHTSLGERLLLMLTLAAHVRPQLLDVFFIKNSTYERGFTEFGGVRGHAHGGFLPTVETALFLIAGTDLHTRLIAANIFESGHYLFKHGILLLHDAIPNEPTQSAAISLSQDYVNFFTTGFSRKPHFNKDFPAKLITTQMEWNDVVLPADTLEQVEEIKVWIEHNHTLMQDWGFSKKLKPGYNCLFYGPPGTGKSLVSCLLGKQCGMDVYRIDLSMIVSKYIGETEKNLEKVFQLAENKNWILFFDEADALFGKRSGVSDAQDRYANQETAYLLQRIEDFNGVVILATNLKNNIDEAFSRRFQNIVYFSVPEPQERLKLWQQSFSPHTMLEKKVDLEQLARKHELTGGMILNVIRYCSLMALKRKENIIRMKDAEAGIQKEFAKEGRLYN